MADQQYYPIGHNVVFENERVRVWEITLQPGETLGMHLHDTDYVVVSLTAGPTMVEWEDGRRETTDHAVGDITWRKAPHAHALTNVGSEVYRNRFVELKG
jgi:quercetin dioxygenase-like cupin family protein